MAYVAFRFEPKFAIPVLIALFHDLLITAGVYSLTGREVTTSTVAALLTILGFSLYDTVIVFDRIRENAPRMPRAAFSQIVNRSMSEVLTRSLATSLCTLMAGGRAAAVRRRDAEGLRLRAAGRDRVRYLLVDLHRGAGADRLEGARADLPPATAAHRSTSTGSCRRTRSRRTAGEHEGDHEPGDRPAKREPRSRRKPAPQPEPVAPRTPDEQDEIADELGLEHADDGHELDLRAEEAGARWGPRPTADRSAQLQSRARRAQEAARRTPARARAASTGGSR